MMVDYPGAGVGTTSVDDTVFLLKIRHKNDDYAQTSPNLIFNNPVVYTLYSSFVHL